MGFDGTEIKSPTSYRSVEVFLDNLISRKGALIKAYETESVAQSAGTGSWWDTIARLFMGG